MNKKFMLAILGGAAAGVIIALMLSSGKNPVTIKKLSYKGKDAFERLQKTKSGNSKHNDPGVPTL